MSASVMPCAQADPAVVTGTVTDSEGNTVEGADVTVDCNGYTGYATTNVNGDYFVCFDAADRGFNDELYAEATKAGLGTGHNDTETMCGETECFIPIGIVDVSIPEFGVIAAGIAVVGALGIFLHRRK